LSQTAVITIIEAVRVTTPVITSVTMPVITAKTGVPGTIPRTVPAAVVPGTVPSVITSVTIEPGIVPSAVIPGAAPAAVIPRIIPGVVSGAPSHTKVKIGIPATAVVTFIQIIVTHVDNNFFCTGDLDA
jgi:hypothetical protein